MRKIKQIRENYNLITEKEEAESKKLATLVRAGLFDTTKLPIIKRALSKDPKELTIAERKVLLQLLDSLMSEVMNSKQVYDKVKMNVMHEDLNEAMQAFDGYLSKVDTRNSKTPTDKDIPSVLILKRKAIRLYPDNTKVALYYSQALDRYVTVPFGVVGAMNEALADIESNRTRKPSDEDSNSRFVTTSYYKARDPNQYRKLIQKKSKFGNLTKKVQSGTFANNERNKQRLAKLSKSIDKEAKNLQTNKVEKKIDLYDIDQTKASKAHQQQTMRAVSRDSNISLGDQLAMRAGFAAARFLAKRKAAKTVSEKREYGAADAAADIASFIPGPAGSAASLASAGLSLSRGDLVGAALDTVGALPGIGYLAKGAKAAKTAKAADTAGDVAKAAKAADAVGDAAKVSKATNNTKKKTKVRPGQKSGWVSKANKAANFATGVLGAGGSTETSQPKYSTPKEGGYLKVKTNKPGPAGPVRTTTQARDEILNRKAMMQQLKEMNDPVIKIKINEEEVEINNIISEKLVALYESLNKNNRKTMEKMLNESVDSFKKVVNFAVRQ